MSIKARHQNTLRAITAAKVRFGGILRTIKAVKVKQGGQLRVVAIFSSPMSPSASSNFVGHRDNFSGSPITVTSNAVTVSPNGGAAPYTYAWTVLSGDAVSFSSASSATTSVSATYSIGTRSGTARCTVRDAFSVVAAIDVPFFLTITFEN